MSLADLGTLADRSRERYATPKGAIPTQLEEKSAADAADARGLEHFRRDVRERDKGRCRVCKRKTKKTLRLDPLRGEAAHIERRSTKAVRYDRRNGLHMCLEDHQRFDRHELRIAPSARTFEVNGKTYIDGDDLNIRFVAA